MVAFVIFIAGCVSNQPVSVDQNRGLTITSFEANPTQVNDGELVLFEVEVANIGGTTARNAQIDFFGIEDQWRTSFGNPVDSTRTKLLRTLRPPEPARNVPGDTQLVQDELMPPDIPQGVTPTLTVEARVSYDYNTSGFIDIPALSEEEARRKEINKQPVSAPTVVNSAGPIHMSMDTKFSPIRVDTTGNDDTIWSLRITFTNVGDGFPITTEDDARFRGAGGKLSGTIQLLGPGAEFSDCLGVTSGTEINLDDADITLRIRQSKTASLACTIRIDRTEWGDRPEDSIKLIFNLFYRYYVSSRASVTVIGR